MVRKEHEIQSKLEAEGSDFIRMLIPNNYVNKLIGVKGNMVREIAAKSGGARIIIISDRNKEKQLSDCIVTISGSLANKQDAACLIIQQLESFRLSAPIQNPSNPYVKIQPRESERALDVNIGLRKREEIKENKNGDHNNLTKQNKRGHMNESSSERDNKHKKEKSHGDEPLIRKNRNKHSEE
jgi:hypothetical protein